MNSKNKQYIIRKYVMATSIKDALKKEKEIDAEEVYINDEWVKNKDFTVLGFTKK